MKLYYTPTSPFVRKVMLVARERGIEGRIETTLLRPLPTKLDAVLAKDNPLSKIPCLVLADGSSLYDSSVICEYLDTLGDAPRLMPAAGPPRFRVRRIEALADGILEAGIAVFYEKTMRPKELQWDDWLAGQAEKARAGLDALEREAATFTGAVDYAQICAAVVLGWLEFRGHLGDIRASRSRLFEWYDGFRRRPSMEATEPRLT